MTRKALSFLASNPSFLAGAIALTFLLAGLIGHDPWKQDEAYTIGMVLHILESGDWVVPTLAGEPFMEKPPLYYLTAAATSYIFSPVLSLHDGARMATFLFMALTLAFTALAARKLFGAGHGERAMLLLLGSFGLAPHAHEMITDIALLSGFAIAACGLAWALERPRLAGALLGSGVGIGFMSKGLVEPAMVIPAVALLPIFFRQWRTRTFLSSSMWALFFALPWLLIWPIALYHDSPLLFSEWLWTNNFGRYLGFVDLGAHDEPWYYTRTLPWFTIPAGPIALLALWRFWRGRDAMSTLGVQLTATLAVAIIAILGTSATVRGLYALPLLVPLSILASSAVDRLPRRLALAATVAVAVLASAVMLGVWGIWGYGMLEGRPPGISRLLEMLPVDFQFRFVAPLVLSAALITLLWVILWVFLRRGVSWLHLWVANLCAIWGVSMTLLLPWIDSARSFRETFAELAQYLPRTDCVSSAGLGEPQRGMLHYVTGLKTSRLEAGSNSCPYLLLQTSHSGSRPTLPKGSWALVWQGARAGEQQEKFQLYEAARNIALRN